MKIPKKSKYPTKIKVKDVEYTVVFVDQIEGKDNVGLCDSERKLILLKNKEQLSNTFKTFIHEIIHAIEAEYNFELNHEHVYKLQDGIGQLLFDNVIGNIFQDK